MNQRLVESIAKTILAMNEDERRLLNYKLQSDGLQPLADQGEVDKSLRVAEIAKEIQDFEEMYHTPLSELPAERWAMTNTDSPVASDTSAHSVNKDGAHRSLSELLSDWPDSNTLFENIPLESESSQPLSSFIPLTQRRQVDSAAGDHSAAVSFAFDNLSA